MAVLDEVPHVTARIRVAGELATEYDPLDDQESVVNLDEKDSKIPTKFCYIESKSNAEFAVEVQVSHKYQFSHSHNVLVVNVDIDGKWMASKTVKAPLSPNMPTTVVISSATFLAETEEGNQPVVSKFVFAPISKTSDYMSTERLSNDMKRVENLGTIRLLLQTGRFEGMKPWEPSRRYDGREVELAEKALKGKAISHSTSYVIER
ncbi:hypothetical protein IL306_009440 [Fusarium sp. DS 682]|nr:hypothetical protein IL306_009440 [Fusarium sp. DS 682]